MKTKIQKTWILSISIVANLLIASVANALVGISSVGSALRQYSNSIDVPVKSCKQILANYNAQAGASNINNFGEVSTSRTHGNTTNIYKITLTNGITNDIEAKCDMTNDGGGWTKVIGIQNSSNGHHGAGAVSAVGSFDSLARTAGLNKFSDAQIKLISDDDNGGDGLLRFTCESLTDFFQNDYFDTSRSFSSAALSPHVSRSGWNTYEQYESGTGYFSAGNANFVVGIHGGNQGDKLTYGSTAIAQTGCSIVGIDNKNGEVWAR